MNNAQITLPDSGDELQGDNRLSLLHFLPVSAEAAETMSEKDGNEIRDRLRRQGFYEAINEPVLTSSLQGECLEKLKQMQQVKWNTVLESYSTVLNEYQQKINRLEKEREENKTSNETGDEKIRELHDDKIKTESDLKQLRENLYSVRQRLAAKKQEILEGLPEEAQKELDATMKLQENAYNKAYELNKLQFNHEKSALESRMKYLENIKVQLNDRLQKVHKRLKVMAGEGVNAYATYFLISFGFAAIGAAGILYSTFTYTTNFGNQDFFYFLFSGFINGSRNSSIPFGVKLLAVLMGIGLVTLAAWLSYRGIKHIKVTGQKTGKLSYLQRMRYVQKNDRLSLEFSAGNIFVFWLQLMPVLVFFAIVILLLSFNPTSLEASNLSASTEGILLGSAMALGLTGVVYLYIIKIIEPRLLKLRKAEVEQGKINWLLRNWELALCIGVFLFCALLIILLNLDAVADVLRPRSKVAIAMLEFIAVCLLASLSLAYGMRCRGLIALSEYYKRDLDIVQDDIEICLKPVTPEINTNHSESLHSLVSGVLNRLADKTSFHISPVHMPVNPDTRIIPAKKPMLDIWSVGRKNSTATADGGHDTEFPKKMFQVTEWDIRYMPELGEELLKTACEFQQKELELKAANEKLEAEENNKRKDKDEQMIKQEAISSRINNLHENKLRLKLRMQKLKRNMEDLFAREKIWFTEGFHLGIWYREHQMGPSSNYYFNTSKSKGHAFNTTPDGYNFRPAST